MLEKTVPKKKVKVTKNDKPWMTVKIKQLILERQEAFRAGNTALYSRLRNAVAKHIKKAKRQYYEREVANLKHTNPGHWFKSIKALMGMDSVKEEASNPDINALQQECDALAEHFSSVWSEVTRTVPTLADVEHKLSQTTFAPFSIGQIKARLRRLNGKKAAGPDLIPPWVLKQFHEELAPVICDVFNSCLNSCTFPLQWKEAVVRAVPKKPRPHFPTEYRQISLVSCVGKVYEGLLKDALLQDTARSLAPSQNGFLARRSTVTVLIYTLQTWHEALNSNPKQDVHAVFVDFTRAFDTISHSQLLMTLADMGIRRCLWMSISSYLEGRTQKVRWGPCLSKSHDVTAGVPQGGLLSPTLFVICINSLDARLPRSIIPVKYADDLTTSETLMASLPGLTQNALDSIVQWGETYSLGVNGKKTMDMVISARKEANIPVPPHPTISGHVIQRTTSFKLLGVYITANLTWDTHVHYMLAKSRPISFPVG
ncbi:hypothetical protein Bbelb_281340 [Branchiostoma belcheri]|nr:hypothetical protein Bbelb_281340 [Branchiostoma belcheri]